MEGLAQLGSTIMVPHQRHLVTSPRISSVSFSCEATAIYGVIIAIILSDKIRESRKRLYEGIYSDFYNPGDKVSYNWVQLWYAGYFTRSWSGSGIYQRRKWYSVDLPVQVVFWQHLL